MKRVIIFASGSGSNAENIIRYFQKSDHIKVVQVLTNNKNAKVMDRCKYLNVKSLFFKKKELHSTNVLLNLLKKETDYIVLAGFLWKIPESIVKAFPNKIINIHPALLPKYGGKGMYGMHIHKAIVKNKEKETGITIHFVNENYDKGAIIFQKSIAVDTKDTADIIATKIHTLEMTHFPKVIEEVVLG